MRQGRTRLREERAWEKRDALVGPQAGIMSGGGCRWPQDGQVPPAAGAARAPTAPVRPPTDSRETAAATVARRRAAASVHRCVRRGREYRVIRNDGHEASNGGFVVADQEVERQ